MESGGSLGGSLTERYSALIDEIVQQTLKGNIRSKEQVHQQLQEAIAVGTGEIFERSLMLRIHDTEAQLEGSLKAPRILRALKTIEGEWQKGQADRQSAQAISQAAESLRQTDAAERPVAFLTLIDPNQPHSLNRQQLKQLAKALAQPAEIAKESAKEPAKESADEMAAWQQGILLGLANYQRLEADLVSWLYQPAGTTVGFGESEKQGPWPLWQKASSGLPKLLFTAIVQEEPVEAITRTALDVTSWVDLAVLLQFVQRGLVTWFDKQPYSAKAGKQLSYSTFLIFAAIWGRLAQGFRNSGASSYQALANGSFQLMLQILRTFSQRDDFPLYGGVFASFSGDYLQDTLDYFSEPLSQVDGTQEKARILTLLGYSRQMLGHSSAAQAFYQQALEIAQSAGDLACETADLCHLARNALLEKDYAQAVSTSQRALILARQRGDRVGEANALVNLGYAQVLQGRANDVIDPALYDGAIAYLNQGLELAVKQGDFQSQALAYNSLGIGYVMCDRPQEGLDILTKGAEPLKASRNIYLQGLYTLYTAEAHHALKHPQEAVFYSTLAMHLLESIGSEDWRQAAGLASILQGQLGPETFKQTLEKYRRQLAPIISLEGFERLPELLKQYQQQ
ncbi:MAG: tetratricopeptide repeat protein [Phormidesmis sp. RL_2_1]|nr:tetratricopeptide repeat protein [Phormidesmis sp. RL_2_1]